MTVGALKEFLSKLPDDMEVMIDEYDAPGYDYADAQIIYIISESGSEEKIVRIF